MFAIGTKVGPFWIESCRDERTRQYIVRCDGNHHQLKSDTDLNAGTACEKCKPRKKHRRGYKCGEVPEAYFNSLKRGADARGIPFDLRIEDVDEAFTRQDGRCALSGLKLFFKNKSDPGTASVDRIDSDLGYTPSNIQVTHKTINAMKSTLSQEKFIWFCKQVAAHHA